jgi:excisionase family DNA binding protein
MAKAKISEREQLLTVGETAELLNVRETTVRAWLGRRRLAAYKLNRSWRIPPSEVERYLEESLIPRKKTTNK